MLWDQIELYTVLNPIYFNSNNAIIANIPFRIGFYGPLLSIKNITVFLYGIYKLQCKGIVVAFKILFKGKKEAHFIRQQITVSILIV